MSIIIDVAAEFTGKKAFKQAETATDKLTKSAKSLGRALGVSLGTAAILGYAKASVKAAAQDQKAQQQLALALKNVGLEREAASAESYIQRLQSEFGIVDDLLRPAYQKLAIATRDTAQTQRLLGIALDISASTGKDLDSVTGALSKAYLGNNTALGKLGVGISKADLKTKSFKDITDDLAKTFKGSAKAASETFAGSIAKLGVAAANVQEIIGTGLIDALSNLKGNTAIDNLADDMERAALNLADFLRGLSLIGTFKVSGETKSLLGLLLTPFQRSLSAGPLGAISRIGATSRRAAEVRAQKNPIQSGTYLNKAQVKVNTDLLKVSKENLKLAKAKAIFDLSKIQIEAALKGKISEEERIRLLLLKAIAEENMADIEKYTKMLDAVQGKVTDLQETLTEVYAMDAGNPFISWEIGLDGVQRALIEINDQSIELTSTLAQNSLAMGLLGGASFAQALSGARYAAQAAAQANITTTLPNLPPVTSTTTPTTTTQVQVTVQGTVTAQADLEKAIQDAINASNASGNANSLAPKTWRAEV
jgi:copper chaperone CopZ